MSVSRVLRKKFSISHETASKIFAHLCKEENAQLIGSLCLTIVALVKSRVELLSACVHTWNVWINFTMSFSYIFSYYCARVSASCWKGLEDNSFISVILLSLLPLTLVSTYCPQLIFAVFFLPLLRPNWQKKLLDFCMASSSVGENTLGGWGGQQGVNGSGKMQGSWKVRVGEGESSNLCDHKCGQAAKFPNFNYVTIGSLQQP